MNKITYLSVITFTLLLTSACSQISQRSVNHRPPSHSSDQRVQQPKPRPQISPSQQQAPQQSPVVSNNPARNRVVQIARSTIGAPYRWGGDSPRRGFDCSGLMKYVHKQATGMNIPRTAAKQRDNSRTLSYAQLQPGDMLFFKTSKTSNHVGVYIGNRQFVHAPSGGKRVKITSMDSSYWFKRFVKFGTYL